MSRFRPCPCGSGLASEWQVDARGIELTRTCLKCHKGKKMRDRYEIVHGGVRVCDDAPRMWLVYVNDMLRAQCQTEQAAKDYVAIRKAK